MSRPLIAPSILAADFSRLADELAAVKGADWVHVDVMDNHFVPNLTLGLPVVESLLPTTDIPMDCHLMIDDPDRWAPPYAEVGAYNVTFHAEATDNPIGVARDIRAAGAKAGLSRQTRHSARAVPGDPPRVRHPADHVRRTGPGGQKFIPEVLPKVAIARRLVDAGELTILVEIDGGINAETIEDAAEAGVDCFVAGLVGCSTPKTGRPPSRRCAGRPPPRQNICGYDVRRRDAAVGGAGGAGQGRHLSESSCRRGDPGIETAKSSVSARPRRPVARTRRRWRCVGQARAPRAVRLWSPSSRATITAGRRCVSTPLSPRVSRQSLSQSTIPMPRRQGERSGLSDSGVNVIAGVLADEVASGPLREWLHKQKNRKPACHLEIRDQHRWPQRRCRRQQSVDHQRVRPR